MSAMGSPFCEIQTHPISSNVKTSTQRLLPWDRVQGECYYRSHKHKEKPCHCEKTRKHIQLLTMVVCEQTDFEAQKNYICPRNNIAQLILYIKAIQPTQWRI